MSQAESQRSTRELLQQAVGHASLDAAGHAWRELVERHADDAALLAWIRSGSEQRLLPLLGDRADALGLSPDVVSACTMATHEAWGLNERLLASIRPLLDGWRDAGVDVVVLKGLGLLGDVYPSHRLRPIGDADLMIRAAHVGAALDVLGSTGWQVPSDLAGMIRLGVGATNLGLTGSASAGVGNGSSIDLHLVPVRTLPRGADISTLWDNAEALPPDHPLAGTGVLRLATVDHAWLIAAHIARANNRAIAHPLIDLHRMFAAHPDMQTAGTAARLNELADRYGLSLRIAQVLDHAVDLLGTAVPANASSRPTVPSRRAATERRAIAAEVRIEGNRYGRGAALRRAVDHSTVATGGRRGAPWVRAFGEVVMRWTIIHRDRVRRRLPRLAR